MPAVGKIFNYFFNCTKICESRQSRKRKKNVEYLALLSTWTFIWDTLA